MAERRRRHRGFEFRIVDAVELELEEQKIASERRYALLRVAVEFRARTGRWCRKHRAAMRRT